MTGRVLVLPLSFISMIVAGCSGSIIVPQPPPDIGVNIDGSLPDMTRTCTPRHSSKITCPGPEYMADTGHRGCDYIHDICADYGMAGGNHYWDMGAEPLGCGDDAIVYGRFFDAIQFPKVSGLTRVYEVKTWGWSKYEKARQLQKIQEAIGEMMRDYETAKKCGMAYTFLVADKPFWMALLAERAANGTIPPDSEDFLLAYTASCDPNSAPDSDPDR